VISSSDSSIILRCSLCGVVVGRLQASRGRWFWVFAKSTASTVIQFDSIEGRIQLVIAGRAQAMAIDVFISGGEGSTKIDQRRCEGGGTNH